MFALIWMWVACDTPPPATPTSPTPTPEVHAEAAPPATPPPAARPDQPLPDRITARHILVAYQGAERSRSVRPREEALERAEQIRARVLADPTQFDALAFEMSDGPSNVLGGHLGSFEAGVMDPNFEATAFRLEVNAISAVVETPFGFHIIQRLPSDEICVTHVLVQWEGLDRSQATRSQEEAQAIIASARERLLAGEPIATIAAELSDGPNALRGGDLGCFQRGQLVPAFDAAAFQLQPGEASEIVESPMGYHLIVRNPDPIGG